MAAEDHLLAALSTVGRKMSSFLKIQVVYYSMCHIL
jgi:hypothetical protein